MVLKFISAVSQWFDERLWIVWLMTGLSLLTVLASFIIVPWAIVRIPADYFASQRAPRTPWEKLHPALRLAILLAKNLFGLVLLLAGVVMALPLVPGPGVLTVLLGLALMDLPGKRRVERWIVAQPRIFDALNRLRAKHHQPPLDAPR